MVYSQPKRTKSPKSHQSVTRYHGHQQVTKVIPAIGAVLVAGVIYLTLRTKASDTFMGIDFSSPTGWRRVEAALNIDHSIDYSGG